MSLAQPVVHFPDFGVPAGPEFTALVSLIGGRADVSPLRHFFSDDLDAVDVGRLGIVL